MAGENYLSRRDFLKKSAYAGAGMGLILLGGCFPERKIRVNWNNSSQQASQGSDDCVYYYTDRSGSRHYVDRDVYINPPPGVVIRREYVRDLMRGDPDAYRLYQDLRDIQRDEDRYQLRHDQIDRREFRERRKRQKAYDRYIRSKQRDD